MKIIEKIILLIPFNDFDNRYSTINKINKIYENNEINKINSFEKIPNRSSIEKSFTK